MAFVLAVLGFVVSLTAIANPPTTMEPVLGAGSSAHRRDPIFPPVTAILAHSIPNPRSDFGEETILVEQVKHDRYYAAIDPMIDLSRDRRADLMEMAVSVRKQLDHDSPLHVRAE